MKPSQSTTTEQHLIQKNAKAGSNPRIEWLDVARGLCMLLIIYDHSDSYFTLLKPLLPYNWYVANVLCAFVFISGYLFPTHTQLVVSKKIKSIFRTLWCPISFLAPFSPSKSLYSSARYKHFRIAFQHTQRSIVLVYLRPCGVRTALRGFSSAV